MYLSDNLIIFRNPHQTSRMPSIGTSIGDLRARISEDCKTSDNLQNRINQIRQDLVEGKKPTTTNIEIMEACNKDMTRELIQRIDEIENRGPISPTDREMLQALNSRLIVCDRHAMRLAELRDVQLEALGEKAREYLEPESTLPRSDTPEESIMELPSLIPTTNIRVAVPQISLQIDTGLLGQNEEESPTDDKASESGASDNLEEQINERSKWPLFYRILDISPAIDRDNFPQEAQRAHAKLRIQHDPKLLPNDPTAPARWAAISKAHGVLTDPNRKLFYDMHNMYDSTTLEMNGFDQLEKYVLAYDASFSRELFPMPATA